MRWLLPGAWISGAWLGALMTAALLPGMMPLARAADPSLYDWQQHPGTLVPLDVAVRDEAGRALPLSRLFHGVPVILDLGYFTCPSLCGIVRANLFDALDKSGLRASRDFELASLSIDAREMPADAAAAKARDLNFWRGADPAGLHYLTGAQDTIDAITQAAGFRADYDPRYRQFLHPTGVVLLTGSGVISSYLLGVGYSAGDLRAGLIRAQSGGIARAALPILLLCFHYDPGTGHYTLVIMKLLRLMGVLTVLTIIGTCVVLSRQRPRGAK
jgi:protein SCO1/2